MFTIINLFGLQIHRLIVQHSNYCIAVSTVDPIASSHRILSTIVFTEQGVVGSISTTPMPFNVSAPQLAYTCSVIGFHTTDKGYGHSLDDTMMVI